MTLRNYPGLLRTELNHYKVYNEVLAAVEKWEDGEEFCHPSGNSSGEKDRSTITIF